LERLLETESVGDVAALITEPYQGAAGSIMPPEGWLARISAWCREREIVFILDEVQSSFGRTGTMFMFEQLGFVPDLMTLGKGLGSGVAVAAVVGRSDIMDAVPPGGMSSTYGGNPLCCAAALESIAIIERERLCERVARLGPSLGERLRALQERHPCIGEVRGLGFVWGLEVVTDPRSRNPDAPRAQRIVNEACRRGLLLIAPIGFHGNVIRLAPPLTMEEDHLWMACQILEAAVEASAA
jgi:4-aminobutyrate aminotransferase-like enzyme